MTDNDTICALATPVGGALTIIRISGPSTLNMIKAVCGSRIASLPPNSVGFCRIYEPRGNEAKQQVRGAQELGAQERAIIDEVMVSLYHAPHSYTGEDSAEITCHGSRYISTRILMLLTEEGCRMANPGEFTQRAFLNGKMDLSQAEAVADLIASTNKATHDVAMSQLRGHFSSELSQLRDQLLKLTSLVELELDFSDHEDLEFADRDELLTLARRIDERIRQLAHSFETGEALKKGIPVAIIGKTNVGKSTLLNRLVHDERAIVSDIHGTTRDTIEDTFDIHGATFRFIDTAGIRQTEDRVEQIGISRTFQAMEKARIILWLIDATPTEEETADINKRCAGKSLIIIQNKIDTNPTDISKQFTHAGARYLCLSAKTGQGMEALEEAIYASAALPTLSATDVIVTNARHYDALVRAGASLARVIDGLEQQLSGDLLSEDLRDVISILAEITGGEITPQETLNHIFSHFCVGK